jgi:tRNA (cmo5U34)-methyltransferase
VEEKAAHDVARRRSHDAGEKSSVAEIRARFDKDVERFSNLETGQSATIDAPLVLELIAEAAAGARIRGATDLVDIGCGARGITH